MDVEGHFAMDSALRTDPDYASQMAQKIEFLEPAQARRDARSARKQKRATVRRWQYFIEPNVTVAFSVPVHLTEGVELTTTPNTQFTEPARKLLNALFNKKNLSALDLKFAWSGSTDTPNPGVLVMTVTFNVV